VASTIESTVPPGFVTELSHFGIWPIKGIRR